MLSTNALQMFMSTIKWKKTFYIDVFSMKWVLKRLCIIIKLSNE